MHRQEDCASVSKGENGNYFAHTLNNTVVAPPRMLIAFLENNLREDGSVAIPEVLRPYMGGKESLQPKNKEIRNSKRASQNVRRFFFIKVYDIIYDKERFKER